MLSEEEKVRVRHHMNYLNVSEAFTMVYGTPAATQPQFAVEGAMVRVKESALPLLRNLLAQLDEVEGQMFGNAENLAVERIGDITINKEEFKQLRDVHMPYLRAKLGNLLGVPPNPLATNGTEGPGVNVPVYG